MEKDEKKCECGCGCNHDEEELETVTITLEDDTELECAILGIFDVEEIEDKMYIALMPLEDETVLLYEYIEKEDETELLLIEDDDEFELVSNSFYEYFGDEEEDEEIDEYE